ncbi:hypothetical protein D3C87_98460 [compost metagenome]
MKENRLKFQYKKHLILTLLVVILSIAMLAISNASECYHYHTSTLFKIVLVKERPYLQITVLDPNGISIHQQQRIPLLQVCNNVKIVNKSSDNMLLVDSNAYYLLHTEVSEMNRIIPTKLGDRKNVKATFDTNLLRIDDKWFSFSVDPYTKKIVKTASKLFPNQPTVIAQFQDRRYLLKDSNYIYKYEKNQLTAEIIEGLNAAKVQCLKLESNEDKYLLTDGNIAYIYDISNFDQENITTSLISLGLKKPFVIKEVASNWLNSFVDFDDGNIWCYISAGLSLQDGTSVYLYPVRAKWLNKQHQLVNKSNKIYYNAWDMINDQIPMDVTAVAQPSSLEITAFGGYFDGISFYKDEDGDGNLVPITCLNKEAQFVNGVNSYQKGISSFFDDGKQLIFADHTILCNKTIVHRSSLKQLELAFAYDDQLLIEDRIIANSADRETMELIGSTVDVIQGCDGGQGQITVVVEYNYFFRDKNSIYAYHSGDQRLILLKDIVPSSIEKDNYEQLRELQKKVKSQI